jgi:hypothetical protein
LLKYSTLSELNIVILSAPRVTPTAIDIDTLPTGQAGFQASSSKTRPLNEIDRT